MSSRGICNHGLPATALVGPESVTVSVCIFADAEPPYRNVTYVRLAASSMSLPSHALALDSTFILGCGNWQLARGRMVPIVDSTVAAADGLRYYAVPVPPVTWAKGSYDFRLGVHDAAGHAAVVRVAPAELPLEVIQDTLRRRRRPAGTNAHLDL